MFLPDVNLWLALAFDGHVHHVPAATWYRGLSGPCFFCRVTQTGFLRLATNPKAFPDDAVSMSEAWDLYDAMLNDPKIAFVDEPPDLGPLWRGYTRRQSFSPKVWIDSYLASFARAGGYELVTFDKAFTSYSALNCSILG